MKHFPLLIREILLRKQTGILTENELCSYEALLFHGPMSLAELSRKTKLPGSSVQRTTKSLARRYLISTKECSGQQIYFALNRLGLRELLDDHVLKLMEAQELIEDYVVAQHTEFRVPADTVELCTQVKAA